MGRGHFLAIQGTLSSVTGVHFFGCSTHGVNVVSSCGGLTHVDGAFRANGLFLVVCGM